MCCNSHNICLRALIIEETKILQIEIKENEKHWKYKCFMEKFMKEKEIMKINRQVDECSCSNVCDACATNLWQEERKALNFEKLQCKSKLIK